MSDQRFSGSDQDVASDDLLRAVDAAIGLARRLRAASTPHRCARASSWVNGCLR